MLVYLAFPWLWAPELRPKVAEEAAAEQEEGAVGAATTLLAAA